MTAPPDRGQDANSAVGYSCNSIQLSVFNCDREKKKKEKKIFFHTQDKLTPDKSLILS